MRCLGITIMPTLAATTHPGAHKRRGLWDTHAQTSLTQDGEP